MLRRTLAFVAAVIAATALLPQVPAIAHTWNLCGDGRQVKWPTSTTTVSSPSSWDSSYQQALSGAQGSFNTSHFAYRSATPQTALAYWNDLNNPDTNIAGAASDLVACSTHSITVVSLYFNFPHFNATAHSVAQKQCTAIHEMAHGVGFDHNAEFSVLYTDHGQRCHNWLITTLQGHDYSDINAVY